MADPSSKRRLTHREIDKYRNTPLGTPGQRERDLALLANGAETGWWDDNGRPAPWPDDFFEPDSGWRECSRPTAEQPAADIPL